MINKKLLLLPLAAAVLTGCTFGASIDTLMSPPKLSVEQEQIYSALTLATGNSISLKYPTSGKYLSAFIVEDIDGDGGNEAVVFYEKNSLAVEENTLRINILDKNDGSWSSVCDKPIDGSEIEKVMISKLGSSEKMNLIIGSSMINRSERNVNIYNYADGVLDTPAFSDSYSFFDVNDLDMDGENEFLLLKGSSTNAPATAAAYRLDSEGHYQPYYQELSGSFTEFDEPSYGLMGNGRKGLYIDVASGTGYIQSDVIYMDENGLNKVFGTSAESLATKRPSGCATFDIDSDGIPEIPVQKASADYNDASDSELIKIIEWMYVTEDNKLKKKYSSYYSVNEGYIFVFPENWEDSVRIERDPINDDIIFRSYKNGQTGRELLKIYCAEDQPTRDDRIANGYMLLHTKGDSAYLAYIPSDPDTDGDGLTPTAGDVAVGFHFKE